VRHFALLAVLTIFLVSGCGGKVVAPVAQTVVGTLPKTTAPTGDAAAGKATFTSSGCSACHTFVPAGAHGKVGPDLDKLAQAAAAAKQPLAQFVQTSIQDPNAYVAPGFKPNVMPTLPLSPKQVADLVAFLTKKS
jgi:cytochrome c551/c552